MYKTIKAGAAECLSVSLAAAAAAVLLLGALSRGMGISAESEPSPAGKDTRELPIIMYHSVVTDASRRGDYVITAEELEGDLRYLRENGYTAVFSRELPAFVNGGGELPEKPVVLSFDDGSYNNFYYVLPLLENYGMKAVFAPVGEWTEQAAAEESPSCLYSYMDAENIRSCVLSGRVEIADHTYSMHDLGKRRGVLPNEGETDTDFRRIFWTDLDHSRRLLEKITGETPVTLVYPFGFRSAVTDELAAELGYEVTLGCEERVNIVTRGDPSCLFSLCRFNRSCSRTAEEILSG